MKFELSKPTDYSDEALLKEIRRVSNLVEKPLTQSKFNQNSKYDASTIFRHFGNWIAALEKAGLDNSYYHTANKEISKEKIISELKRVSTLLGSICFSQKEFSIHSDIAKGIFSRKFGSFGKLMRQAGFTVPLKSRRYKDDERFENLLNVWTYYGRQPSYSEMKKEPSVIDPKTYTIRWGSWTKALIAFIEKVNGDVVALEPINNNSEQMKKYKPLEIQKSNSVASRRTIPFGLRYDILNRDKFCCVLCGRVPKTDNISLQIDHIVPFNGNNTTPDNLRTLCNECNNGKSDKIE